ncbi:hypothetical protein WG66_000849 [Moniliophthora roreri]|nr:hypothetical protein WG66_000849 [Moniliophthora roreri]
MTPILSPRGRERLQVSIGPRCFTPDSPFDGKTLNSSIVWTLWFCVQAVVNLRLISNSTCQGTALAPTHAVYMPCALVAACIYLPHSFLPFPQTSTITMAFEGCSDFTITAEQVSNLHGSQTNIRHLHGNLVLSAQQTRRERTRWDDYMHIQPCNVYLTRPLAIDTEVERDEKHITKKAFKRKDGTVVEVKLVTHWKVAACQTISAAHIFIGDRLGDTEFMHTFKQDFNKFTHIRSPHVAQLFGYSNNQSGSLALIFYNALIPLSCVTLNNNICSPLLYAYFEHQVSNVHGDQTNITYQVQGNLMQQTRREWTRWDDYKYIQPCNVYLTRPLASAMEVERDEEHITWKEFRRKDGTVWKVKSVTHQRVAACQTINAAHIFIGDRLGDTEFMHTFKQDFNKFTHIRSPHVAQLFGYSDNQSGSLALIFYNALIPLSRVILNNNILSPLLLAYFQHQLTLWKPDEEIDIGDLWIDPRSDELHLGPHVQIPFYRGWMLLSYPSNSMLNGQLPPLSIQTYSDIGTTFDYLTRTVHPVNIILGITGSSRTFWQELTDEDAGSIFQTLSDTVFHQSSQNIIARVPVEVRDRTYYYLWSADISSDAMTESLDVMEDGSVRFTVMPMDIQCVDEISLQYFSSSFAELAYPWMTQAHRVFTQLGIDEDEWDEYSTLSSIKFIFKCKRQHPMPQENTSITSGSSGAGPVYLFIQPIPQPSDNDEVWRFWAEGTKYFWSSDSFGKEEMSEDMQLSLGLPSFTSEIYAIYYYWDQSAYEAIKMVHHHHHFDPSTVDLASMAGHSILELVGDDDRFETWEDSIEMTSTSDSQESGV